MTQCINETLTLTNTMLDTVAEYVEQQDYTTFLLSTMYCDDLASMGIEYLTTEYDHTVEVTIPDDHDNYELIADVADCAFQN